MSKTAVPPHGSQKYPWSRWEDGKSHTAERGVHFVIDVESFRRGLAVRAGRRNLDVETRVLDDRRVWFRFRQREEDKPVGAKGRNREAGSSRVGG